MNSDQVDIQIALQKIIGELVFRIAVLQTELDKANQVIQNLRVELGERNLLEKKNGN